MRPPACDAVILQSPGATSVTKFVSTVQIEGVVLVYTTGNPDEATAAKVTNGSPNFLSVIAGKVMTCVPFTAKLWVTGVAGA